MKAKKSWKIEKDGIQYLSLAAIVSFIALIVWFIPGQNSFLKRIEFSLKDTWTRLNANNDPKDIVLIVIDGHSIDEQGPWPWPRQKYASLVDYVSKSGAKVIGLDLLLDIPKESDTILAQALSNTNSTLAVYSPNSLGHKVATYGIIVEKINKPVPLLESSAKGLGHVSLIYDSDGVIRQIPSFISDFDSTFPAISIVISALWQGLSPSSITVSPKKVTIGAIDIPTSSNGFFLIGYQGGVGAFPRVSATDVLKGKIPTDVFKGKVVLIGVTAPGLADLWTTPFAFQGGMSGPEVIANATQAILSGRVPTNTPWQGLVVAVFASAILGVLAGQKLPLRWAGCFLFLGPAILVAISGAIFLFLNRFITITPACLSCSLAAAGDMILRSIRLQEHEHKQTLRLKKMGQISSVGSSKDLCTMFKELVGTKGVIGIFLQGRKGLSINYAGEFCEDTISEIEKTIAIYNDLKAFKANWLLQKKYKWICFEIASDSRLLGLFIVPIEQQTDMSLEDKELARSFSAHAALLIERRLLLEQLKESCDSTLQLLMNTLEKKTPELMKHSKHVAEAAKKIAEVMDMNDDVLEIIYKAGILHDLGLVGVPDHILTKERLLTPEERVWVESHPVTGSKMVQQIPQLKACAKIIRQHHERYDGKGYPDGLAGEEICIEARILAVAEAFVTIFAKTLENSTKETAVITKEIIMELNRNSGTQFDPIVLQALKKIIGDMTCR